ncbi:MAG TPA: helix-turn-helix transcriptional regulator [Jiangellaceae bacterium]
MSRTTFGDQLREWRRVRGLSQLELASQGEVSQRHISFIESGRSRPSREMVLHLGDVLEIPPREQNLLLTAAGHAPAFAETPLDRLDQIADVLEFMLGAHEPNVAIVVDRQWNVVRANAAATSLVTTLLPDAPPALVQSLNVMRLSFHPDGFRRHMTAWAATAAALLRRLERDAASYPNDEGLHNLVDEIRGYPDVDSLPRALPGAGAADLLVPVTYRIGGDDLSFFTTIAIIGDAHDLTLAELRLETFWPMDRESATRWNRLVADGDR